MFTALVSSQVRGHNSLNMFDFSNLLGSIWQATWDNQEIFVSE